MDKDDAILDHGAKRPKEPRQGANEVVAILTVGHDAGTVCKVTREGEQEEEQS